MAHVELSGAAAGPQVPEDIVGGLRGERTIPIHSRELRDAPFDLRIPSEIFDKVSAGTWSHPDHFNVPKHEKEEVLGAFNGWKPEVTAGSLPGATNWRGWR
jgi:hypothetical protein